MCTVTLEVVDVHTCVAVGRGHTDRVLLCARLRLSRSKPACVYLKTKPS
jgi:hypothetical protein